MMISKKQKNKRIIFTILSATWIAFIFAQSLLPAKNSAQESGSILRLLNNLCDYLGLNITLTHNFVRKCAHFTEFAILASLSLLTVRTYTDNKRTVYITTPLSYMAVAVVDECLQLLSAGRACQVADMIIDSLGGTFGFILTGIILLVVNKRKKGRDV